MNLNIKVLVAVFFCLTLSACATTPELNRELVHQEKISTINLDQMDQNISIEKANNAATSAVAGGLLGVLVGGAIDRNTNSRRRTALDPFIEMLDGLNVNMVLKNALEHNMSDGKAFSEEVVIDTEYDRDIKKPFLTPILSPNVVMLADYSGVGVSLLASTSQESTNNKQNRYARTYASEQDMDPEFLAKREANKQYWKDNPLILREKIVDGLYDVAKQFTDDYNADQVVK